MKEQQRIHNESLLVLCHEDVPVDISNRRMNGETNVMKKIHLPRYKQGGVNMIVMAVGGDQIRPFCRPQSMFPTYTYGALHSIVQMYAEERESNGEFFIITSKKDLERLTPDGPIGVSLHIEGGKPLSGQISMLDVYYRLGVRSMQLAWNGRNELADSTSEKHPGGLTKFGIDVIIAMNDLGILIDVSHLAEPSFWDAIEYSKSPIVATHSNAKFLTDHPRNLTDEQIKAIALKEGIIGIVFYPPFVRKENPNIDDVINQIDYIKNLVGVDYIGIGPDFIDYAPDLIHGDVLARGIPIVEKFPLDIENVTKMPNITKKLLERGYKEEEIKKILGDNFLRVFKEVLKK